MINTVMSSGLSWFVIVLTVANILACYWLIRWTSQPKKGGEVAEGAEMDHVWDGLRELNNPLPRWWLYLFYITIAFGLIYLALYPGLGNFGGFLGWTEKSQYQDEVARADAKYGPIFDKYLKEDLKVVAKDPQAHQMGQRLFLTYCAACHGSSAQGAAGFPNLTDKDWLWGGSPETIQTTILEGRNGVMPPMAPALGNEEGVDDVAQYVWSLSGGQAQPEKVAAGKQKFEMFCAGCHGQDAKGNQALGAPNLTDKTWLHSHGGVAAIKHAINNGFNNRMPAFEDFLGKAKVHLLAAYVWSLSQDQ